MRIKVEIKTERVSIVYRNRVISLIKEALLRSDKDYKEYIYNQRIKRPFCFNLTFERSNYRIEPIQIEDRFTIEDKVFYPTSNRAYLYISSNDYRFIITLYNGLRKLEVFEFDKNTKWEIGKVFYLKESVILSDSVKFRTNSPIVLEDRDDSPILYNQERFNQELNQFMDLVFKKNFGRGLLKPISLEPINMRKEVVKHTLRGFREKTGKPLMYITGSSGTFRLNADRKDLQIIYQIGLGNRTSQGFGMLEVV